VLQRELELAKRLEFTHMILHSGSTKGVKFREEGITIIANVLNRVLKRENDITIVLENTAHGGMAVGSDLHDFSRLLAKLDQPDKVKFCIDTAHAYAYGYDLATQKGQADFINVLEKTIGVSRIALIHLNDTGEKLGSRIDRHSILGEGLLGDDALKSFIFHPKLQDIPVLMELPVVSEEIELEMLRKVRSWHEGK
jgi:deoxyribonuclease-4